MPGLSTIERRRIAAKITSAVGADDLDVIIYCDGSSHLGEAGWAAWYFGAYGRDRLVCDWDSKNDYTNQAAEIQAAILAFRFLKKDGLRVRIITDSEYIVRCFNEGWLPRWRKKNWTHKGVERANRALWETLEAFVVLHDVEFVHTYGHRGDPANEQVDMLAGHARYECHKERTQKDAIASANIARKGKVGKRGKRQK